MNLSPRQLRAFGALAQERHFTKAAQRCHTTQPAFSALIKALEDAAGTRLFDRTTRRVELTPEGRLFNESALRLLNDLDGVMQDIQAHVAKRKGRVAVAALPSLEAGWLARSEERCGGNGGVRTWRTRWSQINQTKKNKQKKK